MLLDNYACIYGLRERRTANKHRTTEQNLFAGDIDDIRDTDFLACNIEM